MAAAAAERYQLVRYGDPLLDESRTPLLPDRESLRKCIADRWNFPYPSPYPSRVYQPIFYANKEMHLHTGQKAISNQTVVMHASKRIECVSYMSIKLFQGSILCAPEIFLQAPVVELFDDPEFPIRTTVAASISLEIIADQLTINGADVFPPKEIKHQIQRAQLVNTSANSAWLKACFS